MNYVMIYIYINNENLSADTMAIYYERLCYEISCLVGATYEGRV